MYIHVHVRVHVGLPVCSLYISTFVGRIKRWQGFLWGYGVFGGSSFFFRFEGVVVMADAGTGLGFAMDFFLVWIRCFGLLGGCEEEERV